MTAPSGGRPGRLDPEASADEVAASAAAVREGFAGRRVLVVGDLMLDRYVEGAVERISPEAPVPVLRVERESARPGGAGNVAANLAGLGLSVAVAGCVGDDEPGERLRRELGDLGASCDAVRTVAGRPTTVKTRVIGGAQQMLRLDIEETAPVEADAEEGLLALLDAEAAPDAVVISDYAKGALGARRAASRLVEGFRGRGVPVLVDAKGRHLRHYRGATSVTPNRRELSEAVMLADGGSADALLEAASALRRELEVEFLLLTLGADGMELVDDEGAAHLPSRAREVYDVSGAGDTVVATLAAGLAAGLSPLVSARLANLAAGIVVGKVGTAPVALDELRAAVEAEEAGVSGGRT